MRANGFVAVVMLCLSAAGAAGQRNTPQQEAAAIATSARQAGQTAETAAASIVARLGLPAVEVLAAIRAGGYDALSASPVATRTLEMPVERGVHAFATIGYPTIETARAFRDMAGARPLAEGLKLAGLASRQVYADLAEAGIPVGEVAVAVRTVFQLTANQLAVDLAQQGLRAKDAAEALVAAGYGLAERVGALKHAGYTADAVLAALIVLGDGADATLQHMLTAGYAASDVLIAAFTTGLLEVPGTVTLTIFHNAGLSALALADALASAGWSLTAVASALVAAGYDASTVASTLVQSHGAPLTAVVTGLGDAGVGPVHVVQALVDGAHATAPAIAAALEEAWNQFSMEYDAMKEVFQWTMHQLFEFHEAQNRSYADMCRYLAHNGSTAITTATWSRAAGRSAGEVASALKDAYTSTAGEVGDALKQADFPAADVFTALRQAFSLSLQQAAALNAQLVYDSQTLIAALMQAFNATTQQVMAALSGG